MNRFLPSPLLSLTIAIIWLLLNGVYIGHILLALILAVSLPLLLARIEPDRPIIAAPMTIARLSLMVFYDIVKANIEVAILILGPQNKIQSGFIWIPLDIQSSYGIASLAGIITMTPGTLSADVTEDRRWLLVHCLHVVDKQAAINDIKQRYEGPLREIFR